jgi:hypothetical protein
LTTICTDVDPETHARLRVIMAREGFRSLRELLKFIATQYAENYFKQLTAPA